MTIDKGRSRKSFRDDEEQKQGVLRPQTTFSIGEVSTLDEDSGNKLAVVDSEEDEIDMFNTLDSEIRAIYKHEEGFGEDRLDPYAVIMDASLEENDNENDAGTLLLRGKI